MGLEGNYKGIMVYSEDIDTLFELISKSRELANQIQTDVSAILLGDRIEIIPNELAAYGVDKVYMVENPQLKGLIAEACAESISIIINRVKPEALFIGATKRGKELAPKIAEKLKTGCVSECVSLDIDKAKRDFIMKRIIFGGKVVSTHTIVKRPIIATIPPRIFEKKRIEGRAAQVIKIDLEIPSSKFEILEVKNKVVSGKKIEEASIVICGGRGLKQKEDFKLLDELANVLKGQVGCTRPIAADRGWFTEWIGLSGKKIKPNLYITVGISGAIQHVAGVRGAKVIVSINKDPEAPIFSESDYGIVGDLYKVIPALIEHLKKIK
ncbi:MAG: electron transfer flavoprotein subunit alpha/FixB family protein [Nitrososphaerales archaeon]